MTAPVPLDELARFLVEAKRKAYASGGSDSQMSVPSLVTSSHQLEYAAGELLYRDIYYGEALFAGQEVVYLRGDPIWTMCYAGGFTREIEDAHERTAIAGFLQAALRQVDSDRPYRGPRQAAEDPYTYTDETDGEVARFHGTERIRKGGELLYELRYIGGLLR